MIIDFIKQILGMETSKTKIGRIVCKISDDLACAPADLAPAILRAMKEHNVLEQARSRYNDDGAFMGYALAWAETHMEAVKAALA